ncbi:hypothetical protein LUZ63_005842 [Rhynchospora breviuscula]|uniref:Reverse transcriptase domain-containing protein n=1 Tax=Rhynchospora breviuscula TaxID=2022672 RepID=A0A9Q0CNS1_9POAL|nr:hypothetical protein LUZ63_005842 [Rhynchospora breviuscula]
MLHTASTTLPLSICSKLPHPFIILQYADDTLLFATAKGTAVQVLKAVLNSFEMVSGVHLNLHKCSLVPFNLSAPSTASITSVLGINATTLPMQYLGLPLSLFKPDRVAFRQLIDKLQCKLAGWKSALLSRAGRVTLASSVLSTIPVYFMSVFKLPAWVIRAIDRIRRDFIWGSSSNNRRAMHLLSWDRVCLPKTLGGFGLLDLKLQNTALLLRWWWRLYHAPNSLWTVFASVLFSKRDRSIPPISWNSKGSFFWRDLLSIRLYFQLSTSKVIGSGLNSSFWYDNWGGHCLCLYANSAQHPPRRFISLKQALPLWHSLIPSPMSLQQNFLHHVLHNLDFNSQLDSLVWKWNSLGTYTASSAYKWLISTGKTSFPLKCIWKLKVPPSIKLFLVLVSHGRILTQDQLLKRNFTVSQGCVLCSQPICETLPHLFILCPFSAHLWLSLGFNLISIQSDPNRPFKDQLLSLFNGVLQCSQKRVTLATTLWALWLERNNRTFRNEARSLDTIHHWIICESTLFMKAC